MNQKKEKKKWVRPTAKEREEMRAEIKELKEEKRRMISEELGLLGTNNDLNERIERYEDELADYEIEISKVELARTNAEVENICLEKRLKSANNVILFQLVAILIITALSFIK